MSARLGGDEVYRITQRQDGHYVACDRYSNGIGDNIALVKEIEPGVGFAEAVHRLHNSASLTATAPQQQHRQERPQMPPQRSNDIERGREYLQSRKISGETIEAAEKAGVLRYTGDAVLFVGRDAGGQARSVTRRAVDQGAEVQKRDLRGTDKSFPPILPGDPSRVWVVEGGADALAVHEIARRQQQEPPTIIVSGGANCRGWLDSDEIQARLRAAREVTITTEREKDAETQARVAAARSKQIEKVKEITALEPQIRAPQRQAKDIADELAKAPAQHYEREGKPSETAQKIMAPSPRPGG